MLFPLVVFPAQSQRRAREWVLSQRGMVVFDPKYRLGEADREKLAFTIRQTVKRISLHRKRRGSGRHQITIWDGVYVYTRL